MLIVYKCVVSVRAESVYIVVFRSWGVKVKVKYIFGVAVEEFRVNVKVKLK